MIRILSAIIVGILLNGQTVNTGHHRGLGVPACTALSAWPMNEGSGLTLHDVSVGGTNTATINTGASVTWQSNAGLPGTTTLWNGSGFALAASSTLTNFDGSLPFAVAGWYTFSSASATFIGDLDTSINRGWELQESGSNLYFNLFNSFPSPTLQVHTTSTVSAALHYAAITYDGSRSAAGVHIYIDGSNVTITSVFDTLAGTTATGLPARFGARDNGSLGYTGAMAFIEIYPCVPAPTFWATNFAAGPGIY